MDIKRLINKWVIMILVIVAGFSTTSCEDQLKDLNVNPNAIEEIPYGFQFSKIMLNTSGTRYEIRRASLGYALSSIQHFADLGTGGTYMPGDKYLADPAFSSSTFDRVYTGEYKDLADYMNRTMEDPEAVNFYAMGQIWGVVSFHRLTDLYGDIPYFGAGRGFIDNNWFVEYDAQSAIYADMLQQLEQGANSLNNSMPNMGDQDFVYGSDIAQWKKLAYSYMLRLGLRLSKVDPVAAESWVRKAIAGGVMSNITDTASYLHQEQGGWVSTNPFGEGFRNDKLFRLSNTLIDFMEDRNDPRLDILSWVETGGPHKGMPNGYDAETIKSHPSWTELLDYSQVHPDLVQLTSPSVFMTYAEVELMLAEAAVRGWGADNAEDHYNKGVRAAMLHWNIYGVDVPSLADINTYLAANPFDASKGLEVIGEQYWLATFLNAWEGFANYRRTGFPVLTPTNYPGNVTGGTIPRRLTYPLSEYIINQDNIEAAVARQGADNYTTRIWWDK